ncbi:hypothetical protein AYL99_02970 [Fonsecaea erecta]|uniref:DUF2241 domain-containing protein n=1 Tax=Fonsecaea erecta TaxID=1367422 RepID=A0A178ZWT3_9EURO|nr:hypothetical protein AYL99_02970 [Fonsecaea erecta]OAP63743.1 hypothetical protein AYL99_02970 [Fonsecaea erecta]
MSNDVPVVGGHGETSLPRLLSSLRATLHPETYVFATIPAEEFQINDLPVPLDQICLFFREPRQQHGEAGATTGKVQTDTVTLIVRLETARAHPRRLAEYTYPCRMITCAVHSSLEAVGFMAVLAARLAQRGVSVNPVSAFYHDHLFVPVERADEAVAVLAEVREEAVRELQGEGGRGSGNQGF